ncbi:MAG: carbohydrate ABC transporter permease [Sciscionella sp.]
MTTAAIADSTREPDRKALPSGTKAPIERRKRRLFWPFVLPALLLYLVFVIGPTIAAAWISLHKWSGIGPMTWRGAANYAALLSDEQFRTAFVNTLLILVVVGALVFATAFVLTMLLRELRGRKFVRSVLFFPFIVSPIVLSIIWGFIFQHNGLVNDLLAALGVTDPIKWLDPDNLLKMIMLGLVWVNTGLFITIILAGVDRIPAYFYEDSAIAGANAWQRFRNITLPLSWDVVAVAATFWTISSLKLFEFIFAFGGTTNDMPSPSMWNTALFVYGETFGGRIPSFRFGYASASALLMLALFAVLVVLLRRLLRRESVQY